MRINTLEQDPSNEFFSKSSKYDDSKMQNDLYQSEVIPTS